jgi:hypothetical protein
MPKLYSIDVDETLEISRGPVSIQSLRDLKASGQIVGLCGNWALFCQRVPDWHNIVSFVNCGLVQFEYQGQIIGDKAWFLRNLQTYVRADEYIHVGNCLNEKNSLGFICGSDDKGAAEKAGWRFIKEDDFAKGVR